MDWHDLVVGVRSWECALGLDSAENWPRCDGVLSILEGQAKECPVAEDSKSEMLGWLERLARFLQGLGWAGRRRVESEGLGHVRSGCADWLTILVRQGL